MDKSSLPHHNPHNKKMRLDQLLVELELVESRNKAQAIIQLGNVLVNEKVIDKAGTQVSKDAVIRLRGENSKFVSRGGDKLEAAMVHFQIDCTDYICADLGASTGGFTDCLLQRNAQKVYAIDVGYNQLAWKMRQDPRVVVMEKCNARHLEALPDPIDCIVGDLSFISITKIVPAMLKLAKPGAIGVLLIKPQFEVGYDAIDDGLVRDPAIRAKAINSVIEDFRRYDCTIIGHIPSPVAGAKKGNVEELVYLHFPTTQPSSVR